MIVCAVDVAEQRHDSVAEELVDAAAVRMHGVQHDVERALHDGAHILWVETLGHRREATHVDDEDRRLLAFAANGKHSAAGATEFLLGRRGLPAVVAASADRRFRCTPQRPCKR
jgi:hypothetical protein